MAEPTLPRIVGAPPATIETPADFQFDEILHYLKRSPEERLYAVEERAVHRLLRLQGARLAVRIESPDPQTVDIRFEASDAPLDETLRQAAVDYVADWFDLGREMRPFYHMAQGDPLLQQVVPRYPGLRIVGEPDLFEALCWAIIGQQISLKVAYLLKRRFVEAFGTTVQTETRAYWIFPSPERVARLTVDDICPLKFTQKKAEYLIDIAKRVSAGELSKSRLLASADLQAVVKELTAIRGIGNWTANYVVMRCLRFPNAFPLEDAALHNAVKQLLGLDRKPTLEELRALASNWSGWEAYATFYLWRSLQ
jgi:DNA-3-methyladenine glycosylase II